MKCPNCGSVVSPTELFCGQCGFDMGSAPTLLSQKQAQGFYAASTIAASSFDIHTAAVAKDNPYNAFVYNLNMSQLRLNETKETVWAETSDNGKAFYAQDGFHVVPSDDKSVVYTSTKYEIPISSFTFQAYVDMHQHKLDEQKRFAPAIGIMIRYAENEEMKWTISGEVLETLRLSSSYWFQVSSLQPNIWSICDYQTMYPWDKPFLLGIVTGVNPSHDFAWWMVFINHDLIAEGSHSIYNYSDSIPLTGKLQLSVVHAELVMSHTKIWL